MDTLRIKYKKYDYTLVISGPVTVISGDSATGKTLLLKIINQLIQLSNDNLIIDDYRIIIPRLLLMPEDLDSKQKVLLLIDEEDISKAACNMLATLPRDKIRLLVFSRDKSAEFCYGVDNIFELVGTKYNMKMQLAYPNYLYCKNNIRGHYILCEDETLGFECVKKVFEPLGYEVLTARSKDNIDTCLQHLKDVIVLCDLCGLNGATRKVLDQVIFNESVYVYPCKSFEWMLLQHPFFKDFEIPNYSDSWSKLSEEDYYLEFLKKVLQETVGLIYNKTNLSLASLFIDGYVNINKCDYYLPRFNLNWFYPKISRIIELSPLKLF